MRIIMILLTLSYTIAICRAGSGLPARAIPDQVDMLEVNHYFGDVRGYESFSQLILWDFDRVGNRWRVVAWVMMKDAYIKEGDPGYDLKEHKRQVDAVNQWCDNMNDPVERAARRRRLLDGIKQFVGGRFFPVKNYRSNLYEVTTVWPDHNVLRHITAPIFRETYTVHDPESDDRKIYDENYRRGLTHPKTHLRLRGEGADATNQTQEG